MESGSYRGIKFVGTCYKVVEWILEQTIRQQIDIDNTSMQFGFIKGKGTSDAGFYCKTDAGEVSN